MAIGGKKSDDPFGEYWSTACTSMWHSSPRRCLPSPR